MSESSSTSSLAFCSQCGREFPVDDLMPYGGTFVCVDCKPTFLQRIREGAALPVGLNYGSVWYRFLAVFIDGCIVALLDYALSLSLDALSVHRAPVGDPFFVRMSDTHTLASTVLGFAYQVGFLANGGATPGKMVMGLKVVTADGGPISYGRAIGRYFAQILDALTLGIGYLIAFFDDQRRALHDRICGTRVVTVR